MKPRIVACIALLAAPAQAGSFDNWTIALEVNASADRARTSTSEGSVALRGSGVGIYTSVARRLADSNWYAQGALSLRIAANLVRDAGDDIQPLADASLFFGGLGGGVAWRSASQWWASATLGPALAAYVSPRVIGLTDIGIALDLAATRSFGITRHWAIDVSGRTSLAALPDGAPTVLAASLSLGVAARLGW